MQQIYGALRGETQWGVPVSLTSFSDNVATAVAINNGGTGNKLDVGSGMLTVTNTTVLIPSLTVTTLSVTTVNATTLNVSGVSTLHATTVTTLGATGNVTLGDAITDTVTVAGTLGVAGLTSLTALTATGNVALGDANTDTHTVIGVTTFRNAANTATQAFIDAANNRVIVGSGTALGSAADDKLTVSGGSLYVAANSSEAALGLRYAASATGQFTIGASNSNTPDGIFKTTAGLQLARMFNGGGMVVGNATAVVGSETLRVQGQTLLDGATTISTGNLTLTTGSVTVTAGSVTVTAGSLTVTAGGISAGASSTFTGGLTVVSGLLSVNAGQIAFPATQNPSADPNTLDDYEEGTWTPSVGGSATYTNQIGKYTKIGNTVYISGRLTINAIGTGSTTTISGLPFTVGTASDAACPMGFWGTTVGTYVFLTGFFAAGTTTIQLYAATAATATLTLTGAMGISTNLFFSGHYFV